MAVLGLVCSVLVVGVVGVVEATPASAATTSTVTLSSSLNPSALGQAVTFTASVSDPAGAGVPTGTVTFSDGGSPIGTVPLSGGVATLTTSTLGLGGHTIAATYSGNASFTSSAATLRQSVSKAAAVVALSSSVNPSSPGQSVTFTAMVTGTAGSGRPGGYVAFYRGSTSLGTVALGGGMATLSTSSLAVGAHTITAVYLGSHFFAPASASLTQTVGAVSTTLVASSASRALPTYSATLRRASDGAPVVGRVVVFAVGGSPRCAGSTNASGVASCGTFSVELATSVYTATFAGDSAYLPSSASGSFV